MSRGGGGADRAKQDGNGREGGGFLCL